jgi:hypothetical protein
MADKLFVGSDLHQWQIAAERLLASHAPHFGSECRNQYLLTRANPSINTRSMTNLSVNQLKEAIQIKEQIEKLEVRLSQILGGSSSVPEAKSSDSTPARRKMSPATRAKMRAAQQARWATNKGSSAKSASAPKPTAAPAKKRVLTPEGRAKIAAATKARWAARRKEASASNSAAQ